MGSTGTAADAALSKLMPDLLDICSGVVEQRFTAKQAFDKIKAYKDTCPYVCSALIDVLSVVEGDAMNKEEEGSKQFASLLQLLMDTIIPEDILRAELELLDAGLPTNKKQIIICKTKLFFKQSKFNLLREESEGYSKLITELLSVDANMSSRTLTQRMLSLIGTFSLDPNRAIDILLEAFERYPSRRGAYIDVLKEMRVSAEYVRTILIYKFTTYQTDKTDTPFSLYRLAAILIEEGLVGLEEIAKFLTPHSGDLLESHKARAALASTRSKKAQTIKAVAVDPNRHSNLGMDGVELETITGVSFSVVTGSQEAEDALLRGTDDETKVLGGNQKVGLATALLEQFDWKHAKELLDCMPEYYAVQASKRASCALADMVDASIDDLYHLKCAQGLRESNNRKNDERRIRWTNVVSSWVDFDIVFELLSYLGPRIAYRSRTMTKLVRLCIVFYEEKAKGAYGTGTEISNRMMDMIDEMLLPALSLTDSNVALSEEMWSLLQQFPYQQRYRLYGRWKTIHTMRHPELLIERGKTIGRTRYVMKRLSKDTVKMMGRILGKLTHSHPAFVFDYLLTQVQTFDNLILPVVDALRFLTDLELDVLLFCVLEQLASPDKQALKESDGTTSGWLASLSTMVGALLKKYTIELSGMLDYVANQLRSGKSSDLLILNEMLHTMAGVEKATQATTEHIEAMSGGELLRQEAGSYGAARNKKATQRLRDALLKGDLAIGLCILVAQQRDAILYEAPNEMPLKLIGEMADQCRDTLVQFGSFLLENLKLDNYSKRMPPIASLLDDFNVPLESAFFLSRPSFRYEVNGVFDAAKKSMRMKEKAMEAERREEQREEGEERDKEKEKKERKQMDALVKMSLFNGAIDEVVTSLGEKLKPRLKSMINAEICMHSFVLFWMLEPYDIEVPVAAYEREVERIRKAIAALPDNPEMGKTRRSREEDRLRALEHKLKDEQRRQTDHVERVRAYLRAEKDKMFTTEKNSILTFLQTCVLPRAMHSEGDAIFAAKFVLLLHQQHTTNFQTLLFTDKIFCDILPIVANLSENEAHSLGRCLQLILSQHAQWHDDKALFEKECQSTVGFQLLVKKATKMEESFGHEMHAKLFHKWQLRIRNSLSGVLSNPKAEYIHLRNCIVVATKLLPCFPLLADQTAALEAVVGELRDREKGNRDDLSLKAASYVVMMKTRKIQLRESPYYFCKPPKVVPTTAASKTKTPVVKKKASPSQTTTPVAVKVSKTTAETTSDKVDKQTVNKESSDEDKKKNGNAATAATKSETTKPDAPSAPTATGAAPSRSRENGRSKEDAVVEEGAVLSSPSTSSTSIKDKETTVVDGPQPPPPTSRTVRKTSIDDNGEVPPAKKRREVDTGGMARAILHLNRPKNELDMHAEVRKENVSSSSSSSRRPRDEGAAKIKDHQRRTTTPERGGGGGDAEEESEEGEVPATPPKRDERKRDTKSSASSDADTKPPRREKREKERGDRDRERDRREEKERLRKEEKELRMMREMEGPMPPPASSNKKSSSLMDDRVSSREKRKSVAASGDEPLPSLKKARKDKERDSRDGRDGEIKSHKRSQSPPRSIKDRVSRVEKEGRGERTEREKDRRGGGDRRGSKGDRPRSPSASNEKRVGKRGHELIKF